MAIRVHVLRTCDRCGRPIETEGSVPVKQLKEGDIIPAFPRGVVRVVREDPQPEGEPPVVRVLGEFSDLCDPCGNVVDRALETLVRRSGSDDTAPAASDTAPAAPPERRRRAGRPPKTVAPDMPGPNGAVAPTESPASATASSAESAESEHSHTESEAPASTADATPDEDESKDPF